MTHPRIDVAGWTAAVDACPDGFIAVDADLRVVAWNPAMTRMLGWRADEVIGRLPPGVEPEGVARLQALGARLAAGASLGARLWHGVTRNGQQVAVVTVGYAPLPLADGTIGGHGVYLREAGAQDRLLAERNALSRELAEAIREEEVEKVLGNAVTGMLRAALAVVLRPSPEGWRAERVLGTTDLRDATPLLDPDVGPWVQAGAGQVAVAQLPLGGDDHPAVFVPMGPAAHASVLALVYPQGVPRDLATLDLARAVADEAWTAFHRTQLVGELAGTIEGLEIAAAENARLIAAEHAAVQRLEDEDRLKADYIAGITHDLRTPLTALLGFVHTLRRIDLRREKVDRYLEVMERQSLRIVAMVDDLLLAARLDVGDVGPVVIDRVDLAPLAAGAVETFEPSRRARVRIDAAAGVAVLGDATQLSRVVQNLLENALKYSSDPAPVDLRIRTEGKLAVIEVSDLGPGIAADERERVFDRFRPGRAGQRAGSSGLGLYIVRGIVRGHHGEVTIVDDRAVGVTFRVVVPRA